MKSVHLQIDRIAVEGLSAAEQRGFAQALKAKLLALAADGIGGGNRKIGAIHAGVLRPGTSADRAAAQVADAIRARVSACGTDGQVSGPSGGEARRHG